MAAAKRPPKAPAKVVELKKNENRFCASCLRYHLSNTVSHTSALPGSYD